MVRYKIDVLKALAGIGWTQTKLKKYGVLGNTVLDRLRAGLPIGFDTMSIICGLLRVQPGDVIENVLTDNEKIYFYDLEGVVPLKSSTGLNTDVSSGQGVNGQASGKEASTGVVGVPGATKRKRGRPRKTVNNNIDTV